MNYEDPLDEIRRYREERSTQFNGDVALIAEDIRKGEVKLRLEGWRFIDSPEELRRLAAQSHVVHPG